MDWTQYMRKGMNEGSLQVFGLSYSKNRVTKNLEGIVLKETIWEDTGNFDLDMLSLRQ